MRKKIEHFQNELTGNKKLVRQSQIVQSVMYSYDAVISSYITPAIHSWDFDDET